MSDEIRVAVSSYGDGRNLMMTYKDPVTGRKVAKTTGTQDRREAERTAAVWQDELNTGRYQAPSRLTWAEFRQRYEREKLSSLARGTQATARDSLNYLERLVNPDRLTKLTATTMSRFQAKLRERGMRATTVARHLRHVKAALRWGAKVGLLVKAPAIEMPKVIKGQTMMRGRPISGEEFDRMLLAVPKVRPHDAPAWGRYLTGLWLSGLRRSESLVLSWDQDDPFQVDLTGRRPAFRIYGEAQKSGRDEILPMTPDFAQWLQQTFPEGQRTGKVFNLPSEKTHQPIAPDEVGRIVARIGRKAGVVVNKADGKFASAHDLRRSFATRWAPRVKPVTLQLLMRHADISTTLKYYVAQDAADVADELWAGWGAMTSNTPAVGNTLGNTIPETVEITGE
jgi:integrase